MYTIMFIYIYKQYSFTDNLPFLYDAVGICIQNIITCYRVNCISFLRKIFVDLISL